MLIQAERYISHFNAIMTKGKKIYPRSEEVLEIEDLQLIVDPRYPFMNFPSRKYPLTYFKKEMLWKLGASKYDDSIKQHAKMWENVQNPDKSFFSNYGQYFFAGTTNIFSVVTELIRDPDSRRACIPMLNTNHMEPWVRDTVCTESISFRLRQIDDTLCLNCSVHMRSSDSVFGLGTDIGTFAFLYRLVLGLLQPCFNHEIGYGHIIITAASSHIYSTHYDMVNKVISEGVNSYDPIRMPWPSYAESMFLISKRGKMVNIPSEYLLARWLIEGI